MHPKFRREFYGFGIIWRDIKVNLNLEPFSVKRKTVLFQLKILANNNLCLCISFLFKQYFNRIIVDFSEIQTWIIGVESEHADHKATTTDGIFFCHLGHKKLLLKNAKMMSRLLSCPKVSIIWRVLPSPSKRVLENNFKKLFVFEIFYLKHVRIFKLIVIAYGCDLQFGALSSCM